ncbi:MAG: hypothetical protein NC831_01120 [Candidatus Omnitrophica bacterium]|nr:hypothetical protein [Candidatus Omnitrophota bacterium]
MNNKKGLLLLMAVVLFSASVFCQEKKVELKDVVGEFQKNNFTTVIELAERAIKEGASQAEFYYYLGSSYMKVSKSTEAKQNFKAYLNIADYSKNMWMLRQAFQNLISIYKDEKDFEGIVEDGKLFLQKVKTARQEGQLEDFCQNVITGALREVGNQKIIEKDFNGAVEIYKKLLEYKPDDPSIFERIAINYRNLNQNELAAEYYLKAAMNWSAWSSKITPLASVVELLWETDKLDEFSKRCEKDPISRHFIFAADEMKKKMYKEAFNRLKPVEDEIGSKGSVSERLLKTVSAKRPGDPWMFYFFIINFPENTASLRAADMIINCGRNDSEMQQFIKKEMVPLLTEMVGQSSNTVVRRLFPKIFEMKFLGEDESMKVAHEKIKFLEDLVARYPEDPAMTDVLRKLASVYVDGLFDYRKGKELYSLLIQKHNQKDLTLQLAKCLINLDETEDAFSLLKQFLADEKTGENAKFQAAQLLLEANFFDEGIKTMKEIQSATKNRWLKQQISDVIKDFREYLEEEISFETTVRFVVFNFTHRDYYFTNFISVDTENPVLYQHTEMMEIIPFSNIRWTITYSFECASKDEYSFTQPYAMIFRKNDLYTFSMKNKISFSSDRWRKIEGICIFFPCLDIKTDRIRVIRDYTIEGDFAISTIALDKISPDMKIEVTFSPRAGKLESVSPEAAESGPGGSMVFHPVGEKFEIKIKFKPVSDLFAYYPKVKITQVNKEQSFLNENLSKFSYEMEKVSMNIIFNLPITIHSVWQTRETIYEIDEKIDI